MGPLIDATTPPADESTLWVELLSRHHEVLSRQRCSGPLIRIGRGYDNDVVLDDPHVAARHLRIRRDDSGRLLAEDLGSLNGLLIDGRPAPSQPAAIDGNTLLHIGSTWLRVRSADHIVTAEHRLTAGRSAWPSALGLVALLLGASLLDTWLEDSAEPRLNHYVTPLLALLAFSLTWTSAWAVTSRIFGGAMRYGRHLLIACAALLALYLYTSASEIGSYALSWGGPTRFVYVGMWLLFGAACTAHLYTISRRHPLLKAGTVTLLVLLGIGAQALSKSEARRVTGPTVVVTKLEPPFLRLRGPVHDEHFFAAAAGLKDALDRARHDEYPPAGTDAFDAGDD